MCASFLREFHEEVLASSHKLKRKSTGLQSLPTFLSPCKGPTLGWDSSQQQEGVFGLTHFWTASVISEYLISTRPSQCHHQCSMNATGTSEDKKLARMIPQVCTSEARCKILSGYIQILVPLLYFWNSVYCCLFLAKTCFLPGWGQNAGLHTSSHCLPLPSETCRGDREIRAALLLKPKMRGLPAHRDMHSMPQLPYLTQQISVETAASLTVMLITGCGSPWGPLRGVNPRPGSPSYG